MAVLGSFRGLARRRAAGPMFAADGGLLFVTAMWLVDCKRQRDRYHAGNGLWGWATMQDTILTAVGACQRRRNLAYRLTVAAEAFTPHNGPMVVHRPTKDEAATPSPEESWLGRHVALEPVTR